MTWTRKILLIIIAIMAILTLTDFLLLVTMTPLAQEKNLRIIYRREIDEARRIASSIEFGTSWARPEIPSYGGHITRNPTLLLVELRDASDSTIARLGGSARDADDFGYLYVQSLLPSSRERTWFKWQDPKSGETFKANAVVYSVPVQSRSDEQGVVRFYIDLDALQKRFPNNEIPL